MVKQKITLSKIILSAAALLQLAYSRRPVHWCIDELYNNANYDGSYIGVESFVLAIALSLLTLIFLWTGFLQTTAKQKTGLAVSAGLLFWLANIITYFMHLANLGKLGALIQNGDPAAINMLISTAVAGIITTAGLLELKRLKTHTQNRYKSFSNF